MPPNSITPSLLSLLMHYEADTGKLFWKERPRIFFKRDKDWKRWNTRYAGKEAFSKNSTGYLDGMIFRRMYRAHQCAWALHYGEWPGEHIDHINGVRDDNRIDNLRLAGWSENARNAAIGKLNTSGVLGVCPLRSRWRAYIRVNGKNEHLGVFDTLEGAAAARKAAEIRHGYHPNHGRSAEAA
jgi:hypothetical protein